MFIIFVLISLAFLIPLYFKLIIFTPRLKGQTFVKYLVSRVKWIFTGLFVLSYYMFRDFCFYWKYLYKDAIVDYQTQHEIKRVESFSPIVKVIWDVVKQLEVEYIDKAELVNKTKEKLRMLTRSQLFEDDQDIKKLIANENKQKAKTKLYQILHATCVQDPNNLESQQLKNETKMKKKREGEYSQKVKLIEDLLEKFIIEELNSKGMISVKLMKNLLQPPSKTWLLSQEEAKEETDQYIRFIANIEVSKIYKAAQKFKQKPEKETTKAETQENVLDQKFEITKKNEQEICSFQKEQLETLVEEMSGYQFQDKDNSKHVKKS